MMCLAFCPLTDFAGKWNYFPTLNSMIDFLTRQRTFGEFYSMSSYRQKISLSATFGVVIFVFGLKVKWAPAFVVLFTALSAVMVASIFWFFLVTFRANHVDSFVCERIAN